MNLVLPLLPTSRQLIGAVFVIFKCFGFIPFPFDYHKIDAKPIDTSWNLLHIPFLQLLFYIVLNWVTMSYRSDIFFIELQILSMNDILKYGTLICAVNAILINTALQRNVHRSIWEKLTVVRHTSRRSFINEFKRLYLWKFYGYLGFSGVIEAMVLYSVRDSPSDLAYWLIILVLHAFVRLRHLFHMFFIDVLKIHLRQLHFSMLEVSEYMQGLGSNPTSAGDIYERSVQRLLELKQTYGELWELSDRINRTFGWSQICNFCANFVQLSCDLYWCYVSTRGYNFGGYQEIFITLIPTSGLIWLLLSSAESCLQVASSLKVALLKIPVENDPTLRKIVYRFGLQIADQNIHLTAHGLFEINYSLLKMFGTGITTYMIIFITFSKEISFEDIPDEDTTDDP